MSTKFCLSSFWFPLLYQPSLPSRHIFSNPRPSLLSLFCSRWISSHFLSPSWFGSSNHHSQCHSSWSLQMESRRRSNCHASPPHLLPPPKHSSLSILACFQDSIWCAILLWLEEVNFALHWFSVLEQIRQRDIEDGPPYIDLECQTKHRHFEFAAARSLIPVHTDGTDLDRFFGNNHYPAADRGGFWKFSGHESRIHVKVSVALVGRPKEEDKLQKASHHHIHQWRGTAATETNNVHTAEAAKVGGRLWMQDLRCTSDGSPSDSGQKQKRNLLSAGWVMRDCASLAPPSGRRIVTSAWSYNNLTSIFDVGNNRPCLFLGEKARRIKYV